MNSGVSKFATAAVFFLSILKVPENDFTEILILIAFATWFILLRMSPLPPP